MSQFQGFVDAYVRELDEDIEMLRNTVMSSVVPSLEEYKRLIGKVDGMNTAKSRFLEMLGQLEKAHEKDD